ncbi:MAG: hypothetical protein NVS4B5_03580 [Vulcanimicrobiaceae bacterium]
MTAEASVTQASTARVDFAYRYAPYVGAALVVVGLVLAVILHWPGVVVGVVGLGIGGGALLRSRRDERRAHEAAAADLERQNRDLWQHARALEASKRESETVLSSVRAHLMLIDGSYRIASRYSSELEAVFHQRDLGNENFVNVLQRILSERMFKTARDYLSLLFDPTRKERVVLKVNPLDEVEITGTDSDGNVGVRHLMFSFRRILEEGAIAKVLVSVEDVTERVVRERSLRESEQQKVKQFELLIGILHVDPSSLDGFVSMANDELAIVDQALRAGDFAAATIGQTALLRERLDIVLQRVHNIKGNASLLRLEHFEKLAQEFEQKVIDLKYRTALGGDDFLTVVIGLAAFRSDIDDLQSLRVKLAGIQRGAEIRKEVGDDLIDNVGKLAADLGNKLGKIVKIDADGFDSRARAGATHDRQGRLDPTRPQQSRSRHRIPTRSRSRRQGTGRDDRYPSDRRSGARDVRVHVPRRRSRPRCGENSRARRRRRHARRRPRPRGRRLGDRELHLRAGLLDRRRHDHDRGSRRRYERRQATRRRRLWRRDRRRLADGSVLRVHLRAPDRTDRAGRGRRGTMKLLVVDDSDLIRRAIKRTTEKPLDEIETASNGLEALRVVENFSPDVVTMDISMPEMDGLTCIEGILRKRPTAKIIVISALSDKPTAVEAVRRGAQGFLLKKFTAEALSFEINDLFA